MATNIKNLVNNLAVYEREEEVDYNVFAESMERWYYQNISNESVSQDELKTYSKIKDNTIKTLFNFVTEKNALHLNVLYTIKSFMNAWDLLSISAMEIYEIFDLMNLANETLDNALYIINNFKGSIVIEQITTLLKIIKIILSSNLPMNNWVILLEYCLISPQLYAILVLIKIQDKEHVFQYLLNYYPEHPLQKMYLQMIIY